MMNDHVVTETHVEMLTSEYFSNLMYPFMYPQS